MAAPIAADPEQLRQPAFAAKAHKGRAEALPGKFVEAALKALYVHAGKMLPPPCCGRSKLPHRRWACALGLARGAFAHRSCRDADAEDPGDAGRELPEVQYDADAAP